MQEGCLFHLAEIYDGAAPVMSKGCYAQAWSVGEILRVYKEMEGKKMNAVVKRTPAEWKSFFESEEFVENFTYEGDDLGVSVKKDEQLVTEWKLWRRRRWRFHWNCFPAAAAGSTGTEK